LVSQTILTPGIGYTDHAGYHRTIQAVIDWCMRPYSLKGGCLRGAVGLVTWTYWLAPIGARTK
jgi:hypothetical protein